MSEKSPLFISALELLAHSVELLQQKNDKKNKFIILHLANCIELLLKDILVDLGESIFDKGGNKTIQIWTAVDRLASKNVTIPKKPILEMLIDDRNAIQHKFGYPDNETVVYYFDIVVSVFQLVLKESYGIEFKEVIKEYVNKEGLEFLGLTPLGELDKIKSIEVIDPASALAAVYGLFEKTVYKLLGYDEINQQHRMLWHHSIFYRLLKCIPKDFLGENRAKDIFDEIRKLRGMAIHRQHYDNVTMKKEMHEGIIKIRLLLDGIALIPKETIEELRALVRIETKHDVKVIGKPEQGSTNAEIS
jgi:hypothetical protein